MIPTEEDRIRSGLADLAERLNVGPPQKLPVDDPDAARLTVRSLSGGLALIATFVLVLLGTGTLSGPGRFGNAGDDPCHADGRTVSCAWNVPSGRLTARRAAGRLTAALTTDGVVETTLSLDQPDDATSFPAAAKLAAASRVIIGIAPPEVAEVAITAGNRTWQASLTDESSVGVRLYNATVTSGGGTPVVTFRDAAGRIVGRSAPVPSYIEPEQLRRYMAPVVVDGRQEMTKLRTQEDRP